MTRKRRLGRLLVVALVVAAIVAPASLASAAPDARLTLPECGGVVYNPMDPSHILVPGDAGSIAKFYDPEKTWDWRYNLGAKPGDADLVNFMNANLSALEGPVVVFIDEASLALYGVSAVRIIGTAGNDIICGALAHDNVIFGGPGADTIIGGAGGFDMLRGNGGSDTIWGGLGRDGILGGFGNDTIYGVAPATPGPFPFAYTDQPNEIIGGPGADVIYLGALGDYAEGGGGDDTIVGGAGMDAIFGQGGDDEIWGVFEYDYIHGGQGDDVLYGVMPGTYVNYLDNGNYIVGGGGNDTIVGGGDADYLFGFAGNDEIWGMSGADIVAGNLGDDTLYSIAPTYAPGIADDGGNLLQGGPGNDTLVGAAGMDRLYGDAGDDSLSGMVGTDYLYGGSGNDVLDGGSGADYLWGESGDDKLFSGAATAASLDYLYGGSGADELYAQGPFGSQAYLYGNTNTTPSTDNVIDKMFGSGVGTTNIFYGGCGVLEADTVTAQLGSVVQLWYIQGTYTGPVPAAVVDCSS